MYHYHNFSGNCLPNIGGITLVMDMIEESLDCNGMVQLAVQLLCKLPQLENAIIRKHPIIMQKYTKEITLNMVATLRHCQKYVNYFNDKLVSEIFRYSEVIRTSVGSFTDKWPQPLIHVALKSKVKKIN